MQTNHLKIYSRQDVLSLVKLRRYETKLGERIHVISDPSTLEKSIQALPVRYVIIGVPEDIGVQANRCQSGTSSAWLNFLQYFLNIQSNDFLTGEQVAVLGHFDFGDIQYLIDRNDEDEEEKIAAYRHAVNTVDDEVESLVKVVIASNKVPIVIGGGHNNSYPLIKGAAKGLQKAHQLPLPQINCINLDAHTDYRPSEGRHSGNG